jgi:biofilm PGA synthesis N-glycosyltransferase PgaC
MKRSGWSARRITLLCAMGLPLLVLVLVAIVALRHSDHRIPAFFARLSVGVLTSFLLLLTLRYVLVLFLSHRHHIRCPSRAVADELAGADRPCDDRTDLPGVTILVPGYNEGKVIEASIRSLLALNYPVVQVLVIDDGSTDDTFARASTLECSQGRKTVTVLSQPNAGKAEALNHGIRKAAHDFIMCVDADSKIEPDSLLHAMRHFADPSVVAVAGNVKVVNRGHFLTDLQSLEYIQGLNMVRRAQGLFGAVNIIPGPCGVFRKDLLLRVGGYDRDTFAEDCDLTIKILGTGGRIVYEPYAVAWTEAPETVDSFMRQRYRWTRGILQSLRKHSELMTGRTTPKTRITLWYMAFEALLWPAMNIFASFFFLYIVFFFSLGRFVVTWWMQLTVLDISASLLCLIMERETMRLVLFSIPYRFVFVTMTDVCKLIASIEELFSVEMTWGKLERVGRI